MSDTDLKEKEQAAIDPAGFEKEFGSSFSNDEKSKLNDLSNQVGGDSGKKSRGRFSTRRKKAAIGGVTGLVIGTSFGVFTVVSGPLQFIHLAQLMQKFHFSNQEDASDNRTSKLARYIRHRNAPQNTRLGVFANAFADRIEGRMRASGIESSYTSRLGYLDGYNIDPNNIPEQSRIGDLEGQPPDRVAAQVAERYGIDPSRVTVAAGGRVDIDSSGLGYRQSRQLMKGVLQDAGYSKIGAAMRSRIMGARAGIDWHPIKRVDKKVLTTVEARFQKWRQDRQDRIDNGDTTRTTSVAQEDLDGDGVATPDPDASAVEAAIDETASLGQGAADDIASGAPGAADDLNAHVGSRLNGLRAAGGISAAIGILCTIKAVADNVDNVKHANVILPLMRMGMEAITVGNQVMTGQDVDLEQLGFYVKQLNSEETGSWASARSIQAENGEEQTGADLRDEAEIETGKNVVSQFIGGIPGLDPVCRATGSVIGQVVTFTIDLAGGPVTAIVGTGVGLAFGPALIDGLTRWIAGHPIDINVAGADYGNYINYGARLASNDSAAAGGGRALSGTESIALRDMRLEDEANEVRYASMYDRLFNPVNAYSLASKFIDKQPSDANSTFARLPSLVGSFGSIFSGLGKTLTPSVAAATNYSYGFPEFGFSEEELSSGNVNNPYENGSEVLVILSDDTKYTRYSDLTKKCFGINITKQGGVTSEGSVPKMSDMPEDCKSTDTEWLQIRMYIFDTQLADSSMCYEGDETSCANVGFR